MKALGAPGRMTKSRFGFRFTPLRLRTGDKGAPCGSLEAFVEREDDGRRVSDCNTKSESFSKLEEEDDDDEDNDDKFL